MAANTPSQSADVPSSSMLVADIPNLVYNRNSDRPARHPVPDVPDTFSLLQHVLATTYAGGMELKDEEAKEFRESWKQDFGEDLSPDRARSEALRLLDFFATLDEAHRTVEEEGSSPLSDATTL